MYDPGDSFGSGAAFDAVPSCRQETITTLTPCTLYRLLRSDLVMEVERSTELKIRYGTRVRS